VEVYDLSPEKLSSVTVSATVPATDTTGMAPAVFTFTRVGPVTDPVTIHYSVSGSAAAGTDYQPLPGNVTIPAGASSATVSVVPMASPENINNRTATLTIVPDKSYGVGARDYASVTIFANSGTLYVSNLRAEAGATTSTAFGTATIQLSPDETSAFVNVSFSNLSSPQVVAHLEIDGNYVFSLPFGQVTNAYWSLQPTGTYTSADLVAALKAGRVSVSIDTARYPGGELVGGFIRSSGTAAFNPPAAPPALDLTRITTREAARFLTQATFGPTETEINALVATGYNAWLAGQMAAPISLHREAVMADFDANRTSGGVGNRDPVTQAYARPGTTHRQAAWWKVAVTGPDQLRQRMAFALSQIFVISDNDGIVAQWQEGAANYYDHLVRGAFGNFRDLLEQVTLSPMMGVYLSSLRNQKEANNATPDENYAREVMQLFTIGLNELNPDGTLRLDPHGQPIPTYTQETIVETAKVFTGWSFNNANPNAPTLNNLFRGGGADYINPMMLWPAFHDDTRKVIVSGKVLPAGQGGVNDLRDTLDTLFHHPNTGPFIARQLIQRFVTSNPSPGYVYRVAQAFADNGAGVRGDLGAVVRAILMDYEARSMAVAGTATFGKLKEPILRGTALFRAFNAASNAGRYNISIAARDLAQAPLRAPTVFNFFEPGYVLPGVIAAAGLYAPEYQILTATTALTQPNFYYTYIQNNRSATNLEQQTVALTLTDWLRLAARPEELVDSLNLLLAAGAMTKPAVDRIVSAVSSVSANATTDRVRLAIYLTMTAPQTAVQK
jgi:uncharacterized protein (DUF1800 family)